MTGSAAGAGASIAGLGDSGAGCEALSSGGIGGLYPLAGLCFWRITQRGELFAFRGVKDAMADSAVLGELALLL